ncbi:MAG: hypothetical protein WCP98_03175 [Actinomycetes bacterium]
MLDRRLHGPGLLAASRDKIPAERGIPSDRRSTQRVDIGPSPLAEE